MKECTKNAPELVAMMKTLPYEERMLRIQKYINNRNESERNCDGGGSAGVNLKQMIGRLSRCRNAACTIASRSETSQLSSSSTIAFVVHNV